MNPLEGRTLPEKIVWIFSERVSEAHRSAIERPLGITPEQFDGAIAAARDLGVESGLRITPIYDEGYEGWWTREPTRRIAALALRQSVLRNLGEAKRNARVYHGFGAVEKSATFCEAALTGANSLVVELPDLAIARSSDWVIDRVDAAVEAGRGFVEV